MKIQDRIKSYLKGMVSVNEFGHILDSEEKVRIFDEVGCQYTLRLGRLMVVTSERRRQPGGKEQALEIVSCANKILRCRVGEKMELSYIFHSRDETAEVIWTSPNPVAIILVPEKREVIMHLENFNLSAL